MLRDHGGRCAQTPKIGLGGRSMKLEEVQKGARIRGLAAEGIATVKSVEFHGSNAMEAIFTDAKGALHTRILTREDEPSLDAVEASRPWSFDADGNLKNGGPTKTRSSSTSSSSA